MNFKVAATGALAMRLLTHSKYLLASAPRESRTDLPDIRYAASPPSDGEEPWSVRSPRIVSELRFNTYNNGNAFIGLQEVLHEQLIDIMTGMNSDAAATGTDDEWAYIGVGRDDGKQAGEYSPILYRPAVWQLQDWTTKWLSPTPDVPSGPAWDAGSIRIVTIGNFKHAETGAQVLAMVTHLDNAGHVSRQNSVEIIESEILARKGNDTSGPAVFLMGDFNSEPSAEAYTYMTREESPVYDGKTAVPEDTRYGERQGTFTGFSADGEITELDYIFLQKGERWTPKTYAVLGNVFDDGVYYSDHRAVVADVELSS